MQDVEKGGILLEKNNKPYFLNRSSKTLHIRDCCPQSRISDASIGEFFYTENEVWQQEGLTFRWCQHCLEWRENAVQNALNNKIK